jgi:uncharacterized RDD family membrane protein YckC
VSHAAHDLVVDSVTGVDVSLAVAGTGARALAFLIDLLIRTILVIAWYVVATLIYNGAWNLAAPSDPDSTWYLYVALPPTLIYALYHLVLEIGMRGRTPGKRMVGIRIVTRNGSAPPFAAHVVRNVFRLVDGFPPGYGVGLVTSVITKDHVRVGDVAAGTLLVYENPDPLGTKRFDLDVYRNVDTSISELVFELLERWNALNAETRGRLARALLIRANGRVEDEPADDESLRQQLDRIVHPPTAGTSR